MAARNGVSVLKTWRLFGGSLIQVSHESSSTKTAMRFSVYLPPKASAADPVPVLYYLSGLTCTDDNVMQKSGAQRHLVAHNMALVAPDTSPRDAGVAGEDDSYDFGTGAGFYVNATEDPYQTNYQMYDYVVKELPGVLRSAFPELDTARAGITGHSMGGHGALTIGLKNPTLYSSVSAFSPICNPTNCQWGKKAFGGYLGEDKEAWAAYDATELMKQHGAFEDGRVILIDQGTGDNFLEEGQLLPEAFQSACDEKGQPLLLRMKEGYDHSYFFMQTFFEDHVAHHAAAMR